MLSNGPLLKLSSLEQRVRPVVEQQRRTRQAHSPLAPYASHVAASRGRLIKEESCPERSDFARDRDRIVHSTAFRRLNYKTQVFIYHEGDHYRSRLTHSLEVAQIARSMASILRLDEDLCEAISLAHDIGHAPFGHAGERALDRALKGFGGFGHNMQTLRTVTSLEHRYAAFDGLNLCWETLEGLVKHNGRVVDSFGEMASADAGGKMPEQLRWYEIRYNFGLHQQAGPEAQLAAIADDIAYNNHDIDDGLRAGLFELKDLKKVPFVWGIIEQIRAEYADIEDNRLVFELNRRLITHMINDVSKETGRRLEKLAPKSAQDIRAAIMPVVAFSDEFMVHLEELRCFLYASVYRHEQVMAVMGNAERIVEDLVKHYMNRPGDLPKEWRCHSVSIDVNKCAEKIRDFLAGMTDRYAIDLHMSLFDVTPKLR